MFKTTIETINNGETPVNNVRNNTTEFGKPAIRSTRYFLIRNNKSNSEYKWILRTHNGEKNSFFKMLSTKKEAYDVILKLPTPFTVLEQDEAGKWIFKHSRDVMSRQIVTTTISVDDKKTNNTKSTKQKKSLLSTLKDLPLWFLFIIAFFVIVVIISVSLITSYYI